MGCGSSTEAASPPAAAPPQAAPTPKKAVAPPKDAFNDAASTKAASQIKGKNNNNGSAAAAGAGAQKKKQSKGPTDFDDEPLLFAPSSKKTATEFVPDPTKNSRREVTPSIRERLIDIHSKARHDFIESMTPVPEPDGGYDEEEKYDVDGIGTPTAAPARKSPMHRQDSQGKRASGHGGGHRMMNIFAQPLEMDADYVPPVHPKTPAQRDFIEGCLKDHFVFAGLDKRERVTLTDAFESFRVETSVNVIVQGSVGDYFYVVQDGTVQFDIDGTKVGTATNGQSFGELALLYNCPRAATCTAVTDCTLWRVGQATFRKILASHTLRNDRAVREILRKVPFLSQLDDKYIAQIAEALTEVTFLAGQTVFLKGSPGDVFYILTKGSVLASDIEEGGKKTEDVQLHKGDYFGEKAIVNEAPREMNVTAIEDATALCLSREVFNRVLGNLSEMIVRSADKRKLAGVPIFAQAQFEPFELELMAALIEDSKFPEGKFIFEEGDLTDPHLYIVRSGKVAVFTDEGEETILSEGGFFGDDALVPEGGGKGMCTALNTVEVLEDCVCGKLSLDSIAAVILDLKRLDPKSNKKEMSLLDPTIRLEGLTKHTMLGAGTFGQVWLVSKKDNRKEVYALKIQIKRELVKHNQVDGVVREKTVMSSIDCPFVIKLVNAYQDSNSLYMVLGLVQGGELFSRMHSEDRDGMDEPNARFYSAGILEGLSYMHKRCILYRDLKPENVLIDRDGYTVIVDLGFAKIVMDKTYTLCGTPLYLAPEVILSRGHDKGADYWSLGCLMYEMILGVTPFYEHGIDQISLFKKIVAGKFSFPDQFFTPEAESLIRKMLVTRPTERIGNFAQGDDDIKNHPWFREIDFNKLAKKRLKAPWAPTIRDPLDVSNFDSWDHLEDKMTMQHAPLTEKEQTLFKDF